MYDPRFRISPHLLQLIARAAELRVWIAQAVVDVPWLPALQRDTAARLAHSSTSIEGNPLTLPEVNALAQGEAVGAPPTARREVLNYLAAMQWIWGHRTGGPIREPDLLRLHRLLVQGVLPQEQAGRYKTRPNRVVDHRGRAIYTPPPPGAAGPLTRDLLAWLNSDRAAALHPVLVSSVAHHRLVSIHPCSDGNGRLARALGVWLLYARGFDTHHLFALDEFFEQDRPRYYATIQQARDLDDDLTHWLEYVAEGVVDTLNRTRERIASLRIASKAPRVALTKRQEDVLRFMRDRGRAKTPDLQQAFRLSRARIGQILKPLVEYGLVLREGRTRATSYRLASQ